MSAGLPSQRIEIVHLIGSPEARGATHGALRSAGIAAYTAERMSIVAAGTWSGTGVATERALELAEAMLPAHDRYAEDLTDEMRAMAAAAGISPAEAVIVGGFTDFVDAVRAAVGWAPIEDTCTAVVVPEAAAQGGALLGQTWDMHDTAGPHVIMLDVRPERGPAAAVFSTEGCLGQIGMNEAGICIGINNLTAAAGDVGVTWPFVVRKALQQTKLDAAVECVLSAELAGAHNYLLVDAAGRGVSIEAMPQEATVTEVDAAPFVHTNHTLDSATRAYEAERPTALMASSRRRLERAYELIGRGALTPEDLMELTRDPEAVCQVACEPYHIESCGAVVMRPGRREMWAVWGRPDQNDYEHFAFSPGGRGAAGGLLAVTNLTPDLAPRCAALELAAFPDTSPEELITEEDMMAYAEVFPEGFFVICEGDEVVGQGAGIFLDFDFDHPQHTIAGITGENQCRNHDPDGGWYYGTDIVVHPDHRRRGIGRLLYELRKDLVRRHGKRGIIAGGYLANFKEHKHAMTAQEYVDKVVAGDLYDRTLTFQIDNGFEVRGVLENYLEDAANDGWAALIVWENDEEER